MQTSLLATSGAIFSTACTWFGSSGS